MTLVAKNLRHSDGWVLVVVVGEEEGAQAEVAVVVRKRQIALIYSESDRTTSRSRLSVSERL